MKVEVKLNKDLEEPVVIIETPQITEEVNRIVDFISEDKEEVLTGIYQEKIEILEEKEIIRIFAENGKVFAQTMDRKYLMKLPLYKIEKRLSGDFLRISNAEIINIRKIDNIDLSFIGTICITMKNGESSYCSRRFVVKIKKILGL